MKQRILVAVVGIPALLAVLCIAPAWATALLLAALSVIAAHELLTAVSGPDKARRWTVLPALCGVLLLGRQVFSWPGLEWLLLAAALALPLSGVLTYGKPQALTFTDVCAMAAAGFAIPGPSRGCTACGCWRGVSPGADALGGGLLQRCPGPVHRHGPGPS